MDLTGKTCEWTEQAPLNTIMNKELNGSFSTGTWLKMDSIPQSRLLYQIVLSCGSTNGGSTSFTKSGRSLLSSSLTVPVADVSIGHERKCSGLRNDSYSYARLRHVLLLKIGLYSYLNKIRKRFLQATIFWDITSCNPLKVNSRFGGIRRLHLQS